MNEFCSSKIIKSSIGWLLNKTWSFPRCLILFWHFLWYKNSEIQRYQIHLKVGHKYWNTIFLNHIFFLLLFYGVSHQFFLSAFRTNDVLAISNETLTNHWALARRADKTIIMPMSTLKWNKPGATNTSDWFRAGSAPLGEKFTKAVSTVGLVIPGSKSLSSQWLLTVSTSEAFSVPGIISVGHTTLCNNLSTLDTLGGKLVLITLCTVDVVLLGDEWLGSNGLLACTAHKTLLMPLSCLILHLLHSCSEDISTTITSGGKLGIIAGATVDSVSLASKLFVYQAASAFVAQETRLMPMLLFVRQILWVDANDFSTLIAIISKYIFITLDTVGMILSQYISVSSKTVVTMVAEHTFYLKIFLIWYFSFNRSRGPFKSQYELLT